MATNVKPIPDNYHSVTPYLYLDGATEAIEFYKRAFGATERMRLPGPGDTVGHAELELGDSVIMLADNPASSPGARGGVTSSLLIYVADVDASFQRAIDAGATVTQPLENKFYGDRMGGLRDPFGQEWSLGSHIEDVSMEEMQKRMAAMSPMPA